MSIARSSLREQIREVIVGRIMDGTYAPGDRIVELQLAQELGTSQAPVREAIRELEAMRLVTSEPHRGARVRDVTDKDLAEVYPLTAPAQPLSPPGWRRSTASRWCWSRSPDSPPRDARPEPAGSGVPETAGPGWWAARRADHGHVRVAPAMSGCPCPIRVKVVELTMVAQVREGSGAVL